MAILRPYRDYDEKDVINVFTYSGTLPVTAGTLVKIQRGFISTDEPLEMIGAPGAAYNNTVSQRYGAYAKVTACGAGGTPIGMLLMDVRDTDENGEKLLYNPRKAAEMGCVISGQAVPIVTRGTFLYSGATLASETPAAHDKLYAAAGGDMTTTPTSGLVQYWATASGISAVSGITSPSVGYCLGGLAVGSGVMIRLNID